jgi:hypothetical protein
LPSIGRPSASTTRPSHRERALAREADHLAGHARARLDLDLEPAADLHRRDRPGDLDEEAAHRRDAAVDRDVGQRLEGRPRPRQQTVAFLFHGARPSTFRLRVSLTLRKPSVQPEAGLTQGASRESRLGEFLKPARQRRW